MDYKKVNEMQPSLQKQTSPALRQAF